MDDRQTKIREGAGLEESRINQDFINFLNKWSSPIITVLAVAALVWAGLGWLERRRLERIDQAFVDLQNATLGGNPSPASLIALADEYDGVRAVPDLAKLTIVDVYLSAYLRGVEPGAEISPMTGEPVNESDQLDENQRAQYLSQAKSNAQAVVDSTSEDDGKAVTTINALVRLGVIAECERNLEGAKSHYQNAKSRAESAGLPALALFAQRRIDALGTLSTDIVLPSADQLVPLPGEEPIEVPASPEASETDGGAVIDPAAAAELMDSLVEDLPGADSTEGSSGGTDQP